MKMKTKGQRRFSARLVRRRTKVARPPILIDPLPQPLVSGDQSPPPQRPFWTWLGWASFISALLFAAIVLAKEFGQDKATSDEAPTIAVDPTWITDDVFRWNGIEWTAVYGGCVHGCALSAVVAKTDACWRMVTGDGSLYLGQRYVVNDPTVSKFKGDFRGRIVQNVPDVIVPPVVTWKTLVGDWKDNNFGVRGGHNWRLHFQGTTDVVAGPQQVLQVVEVQTAGGTRLITKGGSFLIGSAPTPMQPLPKPQ